MAFFTTYTDTRASRATKSPVGQEAPATTSSTPLGASRFAHYVKRPLERALPILFGIAVITALILGFLSRGEQHITPEDGVGYWLGISGATMMLILLLYPLRKRIKGLRFVGSVGAWFRMHMLFGILGPTLILFHANFQLSSANATAATLAMLTVVASGLVGRYLYSRVHLGLYGRKAEADDLLEDIALLEDCLCENAAVDRQFVAELGELERYLPAADAGALSSLAAMVKLKREAGRVTRTLSKRAEIILKAKARNERWTRSERRAAAGNVRHQLRLFRLALQKTAALALFTRLFALWHVMHLPLFILLIATAVLHILAVHLY